MFTTDQREVDPDRRDCDIWIAFTDRFNETRHVETRSGQTRLPVGTPAFVKVQGKSQEPANQRGCSLLYDRQ